MGCFSAFPFKCSSVFVGSSNGNPPERVRAKSGNDSKTAAPCRTQCSKKKGSSNSGTGDRLAVVHDVAGQQERASDPHKGTGNRTGLTKRTDSVPSQRDRQLACRAAQVVFVAWWGSLGSTYPEALARCMGYIGQSQVITVQWLGGGTIPAAPLTGFQGFSLSIIPEASSRSLGLLGTALLALRFKKLR